MEIADWMENISFQIQTKKCTILKGILFAVTEFTIFFYIFLLLDVRRRLYEADMGRCVETCNATDSDTITATPEVRMDPTSMRLLH